MKKLLAIILLGCMLLVTGCGATSNTDTSNNQGNNVQENEDNNDEDKGENDQVSMDSLETAKETSKELFQYFKNDDGNYTISEYYGSDKIVVIPDEIDGIPVTNIASGVFGVNETLEAIKIGNNIVGLDDSAFVGCSSLKYVIMGENTRYIETMCFSGCVELTEVKLNDNLEEIKFGAFATLGDKLTKIEIPSSVNFLEQAFMNPTTIYVEKGSYAESWIITFNQENPADVIQYVAE